MTEFEEPQMGNMPGEQSSYRCTICGGVVKFDGREGEFIDSNNRYVSNPRKPSKGSLAAAHRAGAREACAKLSDWAFGAMEGEDLEAFTAYENCHVSAENLKAHYAEPEEEKKG